MATPSRVDWLAVGVFTASSLVLSWVAALPLWLRGDGLADPLLPIVVAAMMLTPALATLPALAVQRRRDRLGARRVLRDLGMWPLRPVGRTLGVSAAMIPAMPLLLAAGLLITALLGLAVFDLRSFSGFAQLVEATSPPGSLRLPIEVLVVLQLAMIPIGAVVNIPFSFGEELGWRGWLLPALRPLGVWPALVLSGAFWGFWHAPLILLGYNFAEPNPLGLALMVAGCTLFGILLGWTRLRTASVWPAVIAHGAFNASAGLGMLLIAADSPMVSPAIAGPLGVVMWLVFAVAIAVLLLCGQFRSTRISAQLGPDPVRPPV